MILMPFAVRNKNSPENLLWTHCCGWSGEKSEYNFGETSDLVFRGLKFLSDAEIGEKDSFRSGTT